MGVRARGGGRFLAARAVETRAGRDLRWRLVHVTQVMEFQKHQGAG